MLHGLGFYGLFVSSSNGVEGFIIRGPEGQNVTYLALPSPKGPRYCYGGYFPIVEARKLEHDYPHALKVKYRGS